MGNLKKKKVSWVVDFFQFLNKERVDKTETRHPDGSAGKRWPHTTQQDNTIGDGAL